MSKTDAFIVYSRMPVNPSEILIYHITDIENLPGILSDGALFSDARMANRGATVIGYNHIKDRRLQSIRVSCCGNRLVGEFVPFYFCPRSPMLYAINRGKTGRAPGCQQTIVHLVSSVGFVMDLTCDWAISDGIAGAFHALFYNSLTALYSLDWEAIEATSWQGQQHEKQAELLVADSFPWSSINRVACYSESIVQRVKTLLANVSHKPLVEVRRDWYY